MPPELAVIIWVLRALESLQAQRSLPAADQTEFLFEFLRSTPQNRCSTMKNEFLVLRSPGLMAQPCKLMPGHRPALKRPQSPLDEASVPPNFLRDHLVGYCQRWKVEADQKVTKVPHLEISVCAIAADE